MLIDKGLKIRKKLKNCNFTSVKVLINKVGLLFMVLVVKRSKFVRRPKKHIFISKGAFCLEISFLNAFVIIKTSSNILNFIVQIVISHGFEFHQ